MTTSKIIKPLGDGKRRILSLDEAMAQIDAHQPGVNGVNAETQPVKPITHLDLEWELWAPREKSGKKSLYTYDESLKRLKERSYNHTWRHPRPAEYFGLIMAYLEGELAGELSDVAEDILKGRGEWLSITVVRPPVSGILYCFMDLETVRWDEKTKRYVVPPSKSLNGDFREFTVVEGPRQNWLELDELNEGLIEFFYGKSLDEMSEEVREEIAKGALYLPREEIFTPLFSCPCTMKFVLSYDLNDGKAASRGVYEKR